MTPREIAEHVKPLVGAHVRVTVRLATRYHTYEPEVFTGRLVAIGTKLGGTRRVSPLCLVIDARDTGQGVPIVAIRSVTRVEPIGAQS